MLWNCLSFLQRKRFFAFPDFIRYHHRRRYIDLLVKGAGKVALKVVDGYVIVGTAVAFSLFGMLPYYMGGYISITDFFETMSGFQ